MDLLDSIKDLIGHKEEPFEASLENISELYSSRRKEEISEASERAEELMKRTDTVLKQLDEALEEIKDYSDRDSVKAVEDVADNFYRDRKKLISDFEPSDDIEQHLEEFEQFVEDFNDVSRKEGVIMKRVEQSSGSLSQKIQQMVEHKEKLSKFIEKGYRPLEDLEEVKEAVEKIEKVNNMISELEEELNDINIEEKNSKIEKKQDEIEDLKESEKWAEMEEARDNLQELKNRREDLESSLSSDLAELQRGLKKLLYRLENGDLEFDGDQEVLEDLKEGKISVESPVNELKEASNLIEDNSVLDGRQLEKFQNGVRKLEDFEERKQEIEELDSEIEDVTERLDEFNLEEEEEQLSSDLEKLEGELDEDKKRIEELNEEIDELENEKDARYKRLEDFISSTLGVEASIRRS